MKLHFLDSSLSLVVSLVQIILELTSVLCIISGLLFVFRQTLRNPSILRDFPFFQLRFSFGSWLALALEFQLASDIVGTTISPTFISLGKLGAIALIRTFLNYFLSQELENEQKRNE